MRGRGGVAVAVGVGLALVAGGVAAGLTIVRDPVPGVQPDNTQPSAEIAGTGDGATAVLFGAGGSGGVGDETWGYDATANAWSQRHPANAPPARQAHSMSAIAGAPRDVLLYGGVDSGGAFFADTWRWDGASGNWVLVCGPCSPGPLARTSIATDGQQTLMFGGSDQAGFKNALWRFDAAAGDWAPVTVAPPHPNPRGDAHLAFDGAAFVLYGGLDDNFVSLADTWRLVPDGIGGYSWQLACSQCPPGPRALGGFASAFGGALLVGGQLIDANAPQPNLYLSDVWRWDGSAWEQVEPGVAPTAETDDPGVPYFPLLASLSNCALLVQDDAVGDDLTTHSFRLCQPVPPVPPAPPAPPTPAQAVQTLPTFTG